MGRHNRPGDPAQDAVETAGPTAVVSDPTPPGSGRHRGPGRAERSWRNLWPAGVSDDGKHEPKARRARGHRSAPVALHVAAGAITLFALAVSAAMVNTEAPDTATPETLPVEGRFASAPQAGVGRAPVTSAPVIRKTGRMTTFPRPVTGGTPRSTTSKSPRADAPERPRRTRTPSVQPSPGGGSTGPTSAPADPTTAPTSVLDLPAWPCPW